METPTKRRRTQPRTKRGIRRGKGPLVVRLTTSAYARVVMAPLLAYGAAPGGLVDYTVLRTACLRRGISEADFQAELGLLVEEGRLFVERHRGPDGAQFNTYTLRSELVIK
ncbi:hypothetical protein KBX71_07725 [Micromonospora sp. D93]|uniref:hypothetical protein n=1 Tax=Micromonospora sp. D93 TaxID=2824886 RepID=UPI001B359791|nr:hypothetical protein [Micromonospora sp. D93]MBQ1017758.1 hypothetical protein [Micromonospora sp. D93]